MFLGGHSNCSVAEMKLLLPGCLASIALLVATGACSSVPSQGQQSPDAAGCPLIQKQCFTREALRPYILVARPRDASIPSDADADADADATDASPADASSDVCPRLADFSQCSMPGCPHFPNSNFPTNRGTCREPLRELPPQDGKCCYEISDTMGCPGSCG